MYSYKLNNSYTVLVPDKDEKKRPEDDQKNKLKQLEWKVNAKVYSSTHGKGKIIDISDDKITIHFYNKKTKIVNGKKRNVEYPYWITYDIKNAKNNLILIKR